MLGKTITPAEIKPYDILTSLDKSRVFCVCDIFLAEEELVKAMKWDEHVVLKENNKEATKVDMKTFKESLEKGLLLKL